MSAGDIDLGDLSDAELEQLRKQLEEQQLKRTNRKAVALDLKQHLETLAQNNPDVFAEAFESQGVEGCSACVHIPIGSPDVESDPHLQYEKTETGTTDA